VASDPPDDPQIDLVVAMPQQISQRPDLVPRLARHQGVDLILELDGRLADPKKAIHDGVLSSPILDKLPFGEISEVRFDPSDIVEDVSDAISRPP
jgi:hypothetical protein